MNPQDILKQSETWYIVSNKSNKKGPYSYLEMAKELDLKNISFDTLVTRRREDDEGHPIGKISDFSESSVSEFVSRISPPHTTLHKSRSFIRVNVDEEAFLKLPFGNKVSVRIKSLSAGGCRVESMTRLEGISPEETLDFLVPTLGKIHLEPIKIKTNIINQKLSGFHNMNKFESSLSFKRLSFDEKLSLIDGILNLTFNGMPPEVKESKKRRITDIILDKIKNV